MVRFFYSSLVPCNPARLVSFFFAYLLVGPLFRDLLWGLYCKFVLSFLESIPTPSSLARIEKFRTGRLYLGLGCDYSLEEILFSLPPLAFCYLWRSFRLFNLCGFFYLETFKEILFRKEARLVSWRSHYFPSSASSPSFSLAFTGSWTFTVVDPCVAKAAGLGVWCLPSWVALYSSSSSFLSSSGFRTPAS